MLAQKLLDLGVVGGQAQLGKKVCKAVNTAVHGVSLLWRKRKVGKWLANQYLQDSGQPQVRSTNKRKRMTRNETTYSSATPFRLKKLLSRVTVTKSASQGRSAVRCMHAAYSRPVRPCGPIGRAVT